MKKIFMSVLFLILFIPITVFAYSEYLIPSGENIGVMLKSNSVIVVGSYKIGSYDVLKESPLRIGDKITMINGRVVTNTEELQNIIDKIDDDIITVGVIRGEKELSINIPLHNDNNILKTGLYVRDSIRGVATLTYLDILEDGTVRFGALGHEILEKSSKKIFSSDSGTIFSSRVTDITRSSVGSPGEKNAKSNSKDVIGVVMENTNKGVFGVYTKEISNQKKYKVATYEDMKTGPAKMLTVIKGSEVESFDINIIKINENSQTKNILFEITDKDLIEKTGGIIQGMSGSPIIQGDYIIGAINYVLVDSPTRGYGISIMNMLEEAYN